ncbi:putative phosphoglycerate mutase family protein [Tilletiaria anomala UBC 951]|uniref:Putative phosphoglycerate mutase family protein n=1 Tax=Tilletiaria anomala (strain ATCC 24038 / CBS 436.72 / UBC 951) TaxID=1037660 RepID=A0A066VU71_TILAU|nr:putative phosphoglycerate mutase family protein [Tilletiaria anomala UBC 951]KDN45272.1 putative phosphoglycerate mutase family protein [Tilletiaria anomala UBC 951]
MHRTVVLAALAMSTTLVLAYSNRVFLIRHGEKPADDDTPGLSSMGEQRAKCLVNVFSQSNGYNIGYIMAQQYKVDGSRDRPYETVEPLAESLGLKVDTSCDRDDPVCIKDAVSDFADHSDADVLICWEHDGLSGISKDLGDEFDYPGRHYDLIYEIYNKNLTSGSPYSEDCSGLDE